jgi:uncharacterized protein (TIGR02265 family)
MIPFRSMVAVSATKHIDSTETWDSLRARIAATPSDAQVRGMFLRELVDSAPGLGIKTPYYIPFSLYPVRDYMALILRIAQLRYREDTPADAVLKVGIGVYTCFANSLTGMAVFSVADVSLRRAIELSPKAYDITLRPGRVDVLHTTDNEAHVRMTNIWPYPDIFHVGVWLGGLDAFRMKGEISVTRQSLCNVEYQVRWEPCATSRRR